MSQFEIGIQSLKNQEYTFDFEVNDGFFQYFENSPLQKGKFKVRLNLRKTETLIELNFFIKGEATLICDRSLEEFLFPIQLEERILLTFGEHNEQMTEELEMIARHTMSINVAQYIYEFISVAIPMKKLHPRFKDSTKEGDEIELVYSSDKEQREETEDEKKEKDAIDPRWDILKKLKN